MVLFCNPADNINTTVAEGVHIYKPLCITDPKQTGGLRFFWRAIRKSRNCIERTNVELEKRSNLQIRIGIGKEKQR